MAGPELTRHHGQQRLTYDSSLRILSTLMMPGPIQPDELLALIFSHFLPRFLRVDEIRITGDNRRPSRSC